MSRRSEIHILAEVVAAVAADRKSGTTRSKKLSLGNFSHKKAQPDLGCLDIKSGTPEGIRTPDLLIRSQALYPAELRVHW